MRSPRMSLPLVLLALSSVSVPNAHAQIQNGNLWPVPRISSISPAGAKAGTSVEISWVGTDTNDPEKFLFSHPGIVAKPIMPPPPKVDPKVKPDPAKPAVAPPITKFEVTVAPSVPPGLYDIRFVGKYGVSNPRIFVVGVAEEVAEKEPNNDVEPAQKIELGQTINGNIAAAADVDYFLFPGKKGDRILIKCDTASIDSKLYPEIRLFTSSQRLVAQHRPLPQRDGLLDVTLPEDGDYLIRLNQFTYTAGGPDQFYRLTVGKLPHIDAAFPPMLEPGKPTQVTLWGRNLPGGQLDKSAIVENQTLEKVTVTLTAPKEPVALQRLNYTGLTPPVIGVLDGFEHRIKSPAGESNPVLLTYAQAPLVLENDDNDVVEKAQKLTLPCELAGKIDKKRDRDWYAFSAKKGDVYMIEVLSDRLGAPTDMYYSLKLLANKQEITLQDDSLESINNKGLYTANKDPLPYRFVAPADGDYHLMLASHLGDNQADPRHVYRVRIAPEQPDFRLVVMPPEDYRPDTCILGQGGTQFYWVYAQRRDGFKGEILLEVEGLPKGVTCPPQIMAGNQKAALVSLTAAADAPPFLGELKVKGTATLKGEKLVREARPASVTWGTQAQNASPTITRLDRSLVLAVRDKAPAQLVAAKDKLVVSVGDKLDLPMKLKRQNPEFKTNFTVGPINADMPTGVTFANLTFAPGKDEQTAVVTVAPTSLPGKYNLVFRGFATMPVDAQPKAKTVNTILPSNAVELTILPKSVANLSVDNANPTVKVGNEVAILVKVARQFDYADAFKVQLEVPANIKGITAENITIGPGQNEAKLLIKVPADAMPGPRQNLNVKAIAVVNGNVTLVHETKINVNVAPAK